MRTEGDFIKINEWLLPLSWLYGIGVRVRNWMFDIGVLKSQSYDIPVISVGNITVGGFGKDTARGISYQSPAREAEGGRTVTRIQT